MIQDMVYMYRQCRELDFGVMQSLVEAVSFSMAERDRHKILGYRWMERMRRDR